MRAVVIDEIGQPPRVRDMPEPTVAPDETRFELVAAPLNPLDLQVASGRFYAGHPPLPFVPGAEAVARVAEGEDGGRLVHAFGGGLGVARSGTAAEQFVAGPSTPLLDVPDGADPAIAAALGIAGVAGWAPLSWRAPVRAGETVLVLGATGTAGTIAVQAARALGAGRIVAAGRDRERLAKLANLVDATVALDEPDLPEKLREACDGGADLVYDPLWGAPLEAAVMATNDEARIVHLGTAAGMTATLPSGPVRGKRLEILGFSNFGLPRAVLADVYRTLVTAAIEGTVHIDIRRFPLEEAPQAWEALRSGGTKVVLVR
jgi:NADPH:quinone reductase